MVILENGRVALIQRVRAGQTYYVLPGGGIEAAETPEAAAVREAHEELGLLVELERLLAVVQFDAHEQYYYLARAVGGVFGTGIGAELASGAASAAGSYTPVWIALDDLAGYHVRPGALARLLASRERTTGSDPVRIMGSRSKDG